MFCVVFVDSLFIEEEASPQKLSHFADDVKNLEGETYKGNEILFKKTDKIKLVQSRNSEFCCVAEVEILTTIVVTNVIDTSARSSVVRAAFSSSKWQKAARETVRDCGSNPHPKKRFGMASSPYIFRKGQKCSTSMV